MFSNVRLNRSSASGNVASCGDDLSAMEHDPFESPRLLLEGAKRHIIILKDRFEAHRLTDGAISHAVQHPRGVIIKPGLPLPKDFPQIAFDIVNNLRSTLDHSVFSSVTLLTGRELDGTKFPFGDTQADAWKDAKRKCKHVPHDILNFCLSFAPYPQGNKPLWGLNKLRNTKSHRILIPMISKLNPAFLGESHPGIVEKQSEWNPANGMFEVEINQRKEPNTMAAFSFKLDMCIGTGTFIGEPAIGVFDNLCGITERILSGIETETARILRERDS